MHAHNEMKIYHKVILNNVLDFQEIKSKMTRKKSREVARRDKDVIDGKCSFYLRNVSHEYLKPPFPHL